MEFTKEQIIAAVNKCMKFEGCMGCPLENVESCEKIKSNYIISTEKEPASAGTPTSSENNDIKTSTDSLALSEDNVKHIAGILKLAADTLNQMYESETFDKIPQTLSVGYGRAWAMVDVAYSMLVNVEGG